MKQPLVDSIIQRSCGEDSRIELNKLEKVEGKTSLESPSVTSGVFLDSSIHSNSFLIILLLNCFEEGRELIAISV